MYRNRKNIIKQHSSSSLIRVNSDFEDKYGVGLNNRCDNKRVNKSKSHTNILIAKNKKLIDFFPAYQKKPATAYLQLIDDRNYSKKQLKLQRQSQKIYKLNQEEKQIQTFRTSYFGGGNQKCVKQSIIKQKGQNPHQQTLQNDREGAKKLRQRLKKSTSMKNLIQQHFLCQSQLKNDKQKIKKSIYTQVSNEAKIQYDSTKYNWRLSRSKEKSKEKSLSQFKFKANLVFDLRKKQTNKNKLQIETNKNVQQKKQVKHIMSQKSQSSSDLQKKEKSLKHNKERLGYTFGADRFNRLFFN